MHLSENEGIEAKTFLVTGGLGFVGAALCSDLLRRGARRVRAFDIRSESPFSDDLRSRGVDLFPGDIRRKDDVDRAARGADCVFHVASYGMSGKEMLEVGRIDEININGTCHLLDACLELGIPRLVYVSTYNVVFGGDTILNGNEAAPYFPLDRHVDPYSRSKSLAEQLVLRYNGRAFKHDGTKRLVLRYNGRAFKHDGTKRLYTCAIRPAAIYGPGESRHFPRIVSMAKLGLIPFKVGDESVKTDWIYVENLVLALVLAAMGLLEDDIPGNDQRRLVAAGQAYFVSDGSPVNTFEFIRPLLRSLDYDLPTASISVPIVLRFANVVWGIYTMLYPWLNKWWLPQPMMLPAEVYKVGVSHYFSYLKAKQELGYVPMVTPREGMATTISYWQERKRKSLDGPTINAWLFCLIGMGMLFCAAFLPDIGPVPLFRAISLFFMRSMLVVRITILLSITAHVCEALYAYSLAKRVDPHNAKGWFWQTFALGFFSLRFLLKRATE